MKKTVYTVIVNMPGYLPHDDEPYSTTRKDYAKKELRATANRFREDGYVVVGSAESGYYHAHPTKETGGADYAIELGSMSLDEWLRIGNTLPE